LADLTQEPIASGTIEVVSASMMWQLEKLEGVSFTPSLEVVLRFI
jgi:hypothetical protein